MPYHLVEVWGNLLSVSKSRSGAAKMKTSILSLVLLTALTFSSVVQSQAATPITMFHMRRTWTDRGRRPSDPCYRVRCLLACQTVATPGRRDEKSALQVEQKNG